MWTAFPVLCPFVASAACYLLPVTSGFADLRGSLPNQVTGVNTSQCFIDTQQLLLCKQTHRSISHKIVLVTEEALWFNYKSRRSGVALVGSAKYYSPSIHGGRFNDSLSYSRQHCRSHSTCFYASLTHSKVATCYNCQNLPPPVRAHPPFEVDWTSRRQATDTLGGHPFLQLGADTANK